MISTQMYGVIVSQIWINADEKVLNCATHAK